MIDWKAWGIALLKEATAEAIEKGADYVSADCPSCGRRRLQTPDCDCEKCGWRIEYADIS